MTDLTLAMAIECVRQVLDHKHGDGTSFPIDAETSLESLNLDSLDVAIVFTALEDRAGTELDPDSVQHIARIEDLIRLQPVRSAVLRPTGLRRADASGGN